MWGLRGWVEADDPIRIHTDCAALVLCVGIGIQGERLALGTINTVVRCLAVSWGMFSGNTVSITTEGFLSLNVFFSDQNVT